MRRVWLGLLLAACGSKEEGGAKVQVSADRTVDAAPAPVPVRAPDAGPAPAVGLEQKKAYKAHIAAGRALGKEGRWAEAVPELQAALAAIPGDAKASSELGWAAFNAGQLDLALDASEAAVRASVSPNLRAASLYNLGRVHEARGDTVAAARAYRASLELRANDTVKVRLGNLGVAALTPPAKIDAPCREPVADVAAVCACLVRADEAAGAAPTCAAETVAGPADVAVVQVDNEDAETSSYYLLHRETDGWRVIHWLGEVLDRFSGGGERLTVAAIADEAADGRRVVRVTTVVESTETDWETDQVETTTQTSVTECAFDQNVPPNSGAACTLFSANRSR